MTLYVFTDGAASRNGKPDCDASWSVYFGDQDRRNCSGRIEHTPSNQKADASLRLTDASRLVNSNHPYSTLVKYGMNKKMTGFSKDSHPAHLINTFLN